MFNIVYRKQFLGWSILLFVALAFPIETWAFSPSNFSLDIAIQNLTAAFDNIQALILAVTYIIGLTLIVKGISSLSVFGRQTMSSAQRGEMAGPVVSIIIGALLFYIPSTIQTSLTTIFGDTSLGQLSDLTAYQSLSSVEQWQSIANVVAKYLQLIGLIAFVRGWVILSKLGHSGAQPGSLGKGLIHVIGGILLINIVDTFNILASTLGYTG